ncbi:hypothetical protein COL27_29290 [Bacillus sp. AFS075960]|nr:hypothetical protein COL27_29290 [Bacillus sp. AFS075960]
MTDRHGDGAVPADRPAPHLPACAPVVRLLGDFFRAWMKKGVDSGAGDLHNSSLRRISSVG